MPCYDTQSSYNDGSAINRYRDQINKLEAMLCSCFTYLEKGHDFESFLQYRNKEESGISDSEIRLWWKMHKQSDMIRKSK